MLLCFHQLPQYNTLNQRNAIPLIKEAQYFSSKKVLRYVQFPELIRTSIFTCNTTPKFPPSVEVSHQIQLQTPTQPSLYPIMAHMDLIAYHLIYIFRLDIISLFPCLPFLNAIYHQPKLLSDFHIFE